MLTVKFFWMFFISMITIILLFGIAYVFVNLVILLWDECKRRWGKINPANLTARQRAIWLSLKKGD